MPYSVCLPLSKITWDIPSKAVKNNIIRSAQTLSELCGCPSIINNVTLLATKASERTDAIASGSVIWALLDGEGDDTKVLALAIVNLISNLTNLCVLPEHRGKGFGKMLINEIGEHYRSTNVLIFTPALPHVRPMFEAMGWVAPDDRINSDGTIDMTPRWCLENYRKRFYEKPKLGSKFAFCPSDIFQRFRLGMLKQNLHAFQAFSFPIFGS